MSAEINNLTISGIFSIPATDPKFNQKFGASSKAEDVTDKAFSGDAFEVGTADEVLPLGKVETPRRLWIEVNGNFPVQIGKASGDYPIEVFPGSQNYITLNGWAAIHVIAVGGASDVRFFIGGV